MTKILCVTAFENCRQLCKYLVKLVVFLKHLDLISIFQMGMLDESLASRTLTSPLAYNVVPQILTGQFLSTFQGWNRNFPMVTGKNVSNLGQQFKNNLF